MKPISRGINHDAVDRFTPLHFGAGVITGLLGVPLPGAVTVAVGWEVLEVWLKRRAAWLFPHPSQDDFSNSLLDACAVVLGWGVGNYLWRTRA